MGGLRSIAAPFVASGPSGVAVRTRLKQLTPDDEKVLRLVGAHLGSLASKDLKARCRDSLEHSGQAWAVRKRELTPLSSSRWAGSITKATHDQWALARRCQLAHIHTLEAGVRTIEDRLSRPVGQKGTKKAPGSYRSPREWHAKSRRLRVLEDRLTAARADREAGIVHVVRGGQWLSRTRHHLDEAGLTESAWRGRWEAERWFCQADGESGKRYGNETIRVSPEGEVSIKLPAPLAHLANAPHGRYVLACRIAFAHRGGEWADRVAADRAIAYRIHLDTGRDRWYLTASWQIPPTPTLPIGAALAHGVIGVDMNADLPHARLRSRGGTPTAAWHLDAHGNPTGSPRRFSYDLTGTAEHRDAQVRHALTRLLHWARTCDVKAVAVEDLDFDAEKTREKHGRRTRFRRLISGMPTGKLRARLASMADRTGIAVIAVARPTPAAGVPSTGRSPSPAPPVRPPATRLPPWRSEGAPRDTRSGDGRHRPHSTGAMRWGIGPSRPDQESLGVRNPAPASPDHGHDPCRPDAERTRGNQNAQHRPGRSAEHETWQQDSLPLSP